MRKRKGCVIPVFERLLKLVLGEMSGVILDSQRIYPKLLINNGF
jgi:NAD dependent epimerase/dehydratase family enzyme